MPFAFRAVHTAPKGNRKGTLAFPAFLQFARLEEHVAVLVIARGAVFRLLCRIAVD